MELYSLRANFLFSLHTKHIFCFIKDIFPQTSIHPDQADQEDQHRAEVLIDRVLDLADGGLHGGHVGDGHGGIPSRSDRDRAQ